MPDLPEELSLNAAEYATIRGLKLRRPLGNGTDGAVWESDQETAIRALERRDSYLRERDAFLRLRDRDSIEIQGFAVPQLINFDDTRKIAK
jgi:hypothetical protein